jgi:hypothetical protein
MKIMHRYKDGSVKIHIEDSDSYEVTDDNGVDVWLDQEMIKRIAGMVILQ